MAVDEIASGKQAILGSRDLQRLHALSHCAARHEFGWGVWLQHAAHYALTD